MTARDKPFPDRHPAKVDWADPHLQSLLQKTEGWQLDKRGGCAPQGVRIHLGWGAGTPRDALLVGEQDDVAVLQTEFPLPAGEHVRVDRVAGHRVRTVWGEVVRSRPGIRTDDRAKGVHVHWLRVRDSED